MKLRFRLNVDFITKSSNPPQILYPPGAPVPIGVGVAYAGKYVTAPGSKITADVEYTQKTTSLGELNGIPGVIGLGQLCLRATTSRKQQLVMFFSFETLITNPTVPFTVGAFDGQVSSAELDGIPVHVIPSFTIIDGSRSFDVVLTIRCGC